MVADMQIPVMIGQGGNWAKAANGAVQVQTLSENDESVSFTGIPNVATNGYKVFCDTSTSATANTEPPKTTSVLPTITPTGNNTITVTYPITKVTAAQAGATCQLWIFK